MMPPLLYRKSGSPSAWAAGAIELTRRPKTAIMNIVQIIKLILMNISLINYRKKMAFTVAYFQVFRLIVSERILSREIS
jgi:hypothetical protein